MIGLILAGHGGFSEGTASTVSMLTGPQEHLEKVSFLPEDTLDTLKEKFISAISKLADCTQIIVLSDIFGGSPYKCALELALNDPRLHIMAGTNVGMACEAAISRFSYGDIHSFIESLIEAGKASVSYTDVKALMAPQNDDPDEDL